MFLRTAPILLALAAPVSAATVFSDNFDYGTTTSLNAGSAQFGGNWAAVAGSVDYLSGGGSFGNLCVGAVSCVDLDGSTGTGGTFSTTQIFGPGRYVLSFSMTGNLRGAGDDTVTISLGDFSHSFTLASNDAVSEASFGTLFAEIVTTTAGALTFRNWGGDNQGAVLQSVRLAEVPVPAAVLLLGAALGALAAMRRRAR